MVLIMHTIKGSKADNRFVMKNSVILMIVDLKMARRCKQLKLKEHISLDVFKFRKNITVLLLIPLVVFRRFEHSVQSRNLFKKKYIKRHHYPPLLRYFILLIILLLEKFLR